MAPTTMNPTEVPTYFPSIDDSMPVSLMPIPNDLPPTPDNVPTARPTMPIRTYHVSSKMTLYGAFEDDDNLNLEGREAWVKVTQKRIYDTTLGIIEGVGTNLKVKVVQSYRRSSIKSLRRNLQSSSKSSNTPMDITFTTRIDFNSDSNDWDEDHNIMVANGFRTPEQQKEYISELWYEDPTSFGDVSRMEMEVEGNLITERVDSNPAKPVDGESNTANYYIIIGAVGGALLIAAAVGIVYKRKRTYEESNNEEEVDQWKHQKQQSSAHKKSTTSSKAQPPQDPPPPPPPSSGSHHQQKYSPSPQNYFGTIESREGEDDVSTLGDPYFGEGVAHVEPRADETVAESMISSEQEMYVFGVGRQRLMTGGSSKMDTATIGTHNNSSQHRMIFGDDTTLEDAYLPNNHHGGLYGGIGVESTDDDDIVPSSFERLTVVAPRGKLGIVVNDENNGDLPIVHGIKETSVLKGKVNVGDLLISVDEVDCRGMSAIQVSKLISSRSQNSTRMLVLLRSTTSC